MNVPPSSTRLAMDPYQAGSFAAPGKSHGAAKTHQQIDSQTEQSKPGQSESQLRAILDATPFPVALVDLNDEHIEFWSRSALSMFGHTAPTAQAWYELAYPDPGYRQAVIEQWKPALENARMTGQAVNAGEYQVTCKNGSVLTCELHAAFLTDKLVVTFHDVTESKQGKQALEQCLHEKDVLIKEIHHRVKNNLQIISSLLHLQANQLDNPPASEHLLDMERRVRSMALIHEHLYGTSNLTTVDLSIYLRQLCNQLFQTLELAAGRIEVHLDLLPVHLDIDHAIPCGLLVNELVYNAFKHAYPDGRKGEIRLTVGPIDNGPGWRLSVADNGVGLPPGFVVGKIHSMGLQLVTGLARQLGGQLQIGPGPGAVFILEVQPDGACCGQSHEPSRT